MPPQLRGIPFLKHLGLKRNASRQKANVITIFLAVSLQPGKSQIIRIEGHQMKVLVRPWEHFDQPFFVVFRNGSYSDPVNVDEVFPGKRATRNARVIRVSAAS